MIQSRQWWQQRSPLFLAACARALEDHFGPQRGASIILCGSFASGDESIVLETEPPLLLSDVDLAVILRSYDDLARWRPRRAELGAECEKLLPEVRFAGRVDVGLMLTTDLRALPARPGVLDMKSHGRVIAGSGAALEYMPAYGSSDIPPREALILVENRIASLLGRFPDGAEPEGIASYIFRYEIAKVYTDIAAAALSLSGGYRAGYAERAALIAKAAGDERSLVGRIVPADLGRRIEGWTRFKLEPGAATTPDDAADRAAVDAWTEAAKDLARFRRAAAAYAGHGEQEPAGGRATDGARACAKRAGGPRDRWRSWRGYLAALPARRALAILAGSGGRIFAAFPEDVIREHGVRLLEHFAQRGPDAPVERTHGGFPYRSVVWRDAARELAGAWRRLVFGREED